MTFNKVKENFENIFKVDDKKLFEIKKHIQNEFNDGLNNHGRDVSMIPTYVYGLPNGKETGRYLALDLGGTNLRVCEVSLNDKEHEFELKQEKYKVSDELKTGPFVDLFDHMANSIKHFLDTKGKAIENGEKIPLGFTFSFPVDQTAINKGRLINFTKGFKCTDAIGRDVVEMLQKSLNDKNVPVNVVALVNDTVGTLLAHSYKTGSAKIGAIFGTGTNGAYLENLSEIGKLPESLRNNLGVKSPSKMVVNIEWGNVDNGRAALPINFIDDELDSDTWNPRKQSFEKLISGMYLGEILRRFILYLHKEKIFLNKLESLPNEIKTQYGIDTALMSKCESDPSESEFENAKNILVDDLKIDSSYVTDDDAKILKWASNAIGTRAARLSACALAAVVETECDENKDDINIGLDGSVIEFYPKFESKIREALRILIGTQSEERIKIGLAKDGSGVGAALCALQAIKQGDV